MFRVILFYNSGVYLGQTNNSLDNTRSASKFKLSSFSNNPLFSKNPKSKYRDNKDIYL